MSFLGSIQRTVTILGMLSGLGCVPAAAHGAWPRIALPPGARPYAMSDITANGVPTRLQGFVANAKVNALASWFHAHLHEPLVETRLGEKLILGRPIDGYYLTIELEPTRYGTFGMLAIANLRASALSPDGNFMANDTVLAKFPSGSRLLTSTISSDAGKQSSLIAISNTFSLEQNREHLIQSLQNDGMQLERQAPSPNADGDSALFFKGNRQEAIAVIRRERDSRVSVVLNIITILEMMK